MFYAVTDRHDSVHGLGKNKERNATLSDDTRKRVRGHILRACAIVRTMSEEIGSNCSYFGFPRGIAECG